jgi:hypothetical protein
MNNGKNMKRAERRANNNKKVRRERTRVKSDKPNRQTTYNGWWEKAEYWEAV